MSKNEKSKSTCEHLYLDNQLCFSVYTASRLIIQGYQDVLQKMDLTYPQYLAMLVLWEKDEINVSELGFRLRLDSGTLSPLIKKLEKKQFITKERLKEDERIVVLKLTPQGRRLQKEAITVPEKMVCSAGLPLQDLQNLKIKLDQLITHLAATNEPCE